MNELQKWGGGERGGEEEERLNTMLVNDETNIHICRCILHFWKKKKQVSTIRRYALTTENIVVMRIIPQTR